MTIHTYAVGVKDAPWPPSMINAESAGKAKSEYLSDVRDAWPDTRFTDLTVRKVEERPSSSDQFVHVAEYRGLPDLRCGQRVRYGTSLGTVVGHTSSACFLVLFDKDAPRFAGLKLSVHPGEWEPVQSDTKGE